MRDIIKKTIKAVLDSDKRKACMVRLAIPASQLTLHRDFEHFSASSDGCSGWSGHCSCTNNPCMICSNAH